MSRVLSALSCVMALSAGCGDDDAMPPLMDGGSIDALAPTDKVDIPWLADGEPPVQAPAATPCPEGWREVSEGEGVVCDAYPATGPEECGPGEGHFAGEPGCRAVGDACPAGDFAAGLPTDTPVFYVRAGAAAGGSGTAASPFGLLSEVSWGGLRPGTTVALSKGRHVGPLPLGPGVRLIGACAAETVVENDDPTADAALYTTANGEPAFARNLTLTNAPGNAVYTSNRDALQLEGVVIEGATEAAVFVSRAGTRFLMSDAVVRGTRPNGSGFFGRGVNVQEVAQAELSDVVVEDNVDVGVYGDGARVTFAGVVLRDTLAQPSDGTGGRGLSIQGGVPLMGERVVVHSNVALALFLEGTGTEGMLDHLVVRDSAARASDRSGGRGVVVQREATLTARGALVENNRDHAVFVAADAELVLEDAVVRDTLPEEGNGSNGRGLTVQMGARVTARRVVIARSLELGAFVAAGGAQLTAEDLRIVETREEERSDFFGRGLSVQLGAAADLTRVVVDDSRDVGVFAAEDAVVTMIDVAIEDVESQSVDGRGGQGIQAQARSRVMASRLLVRRGRAIGLIAVESSSIVASDAIIDTIRSAACATGSCTDRPFGYGTAAVASDVTMTGFQISGAELCGVLIAGVPGSELDLERGLVEGASIGACIQFDGYDLDRLSAEVEYRDNGTNLQATTLPVPEAVGISSED